MQVRCGPGLGAGIRSTPLGIAWDGCSMARNWRARVSHWSDEGGGLQRDWNENGS